MAASGSVSVKTRIASVVIAILSLFGCQLVAGDFEIKDSEKEASGFCKAGEFRCNGEFLLTCSSDRSDWMLDQICPTADLCDSTLEQCRVCTVGDQRCDGAEREECNEDGTKWTNVGTCDSAAMCNPTFCGSCTPGEVACRGTGETVDRELWRCGADNAWSEKLDTCNTAGICAVSLDLARSDPAWMGTCSMTECEVPGEYRCEGLELRRCRQDLTGWDVVDTCATPEVCAKGVEDANATQGVVDMCPTGCLSAGMTVCDGQYLKRCRDDLTGYDIAPDPCPAGTDCNPVEGACTAPCTEGEVQCNGAQLRRCRADATWEELAVCASPVLCVITNYDGERAISGECVPPGCPVAGEFKCDGAALFECRQDLSTWDTVSTCFSDDLCSAADKRCNDPACQAGEYRCFGSDLRICNGGLTGWDTVQQCQPGQFCSNDPEDPGCKLECPNQTTRCNGAELEHCTPNGWVHQATCATNDLCSCTLDGSCTLGLGADGCGAAVCGGTLAGYQCQGATLQRCEAGRNGWEDAAGCGSAALCYPGAAPTFTNGYCTTCPTAGEVRCATVGTGTRTETCSPDRKTWNASQTCGSQGCIDNGAMDYCAICNAGQVRCSAAILQRCGTDRRSWIEQTCASSALCDAANNQCDICAANTNDCVNNVLHHCSSDGQQDQTQTCGGAGGCDEANGQCDSCMPNTSRCSNNLLLKCSADGQSEATTDCLTAALCDAANQRCRTPTCMAGQTRCNPTNLAQPQRCNSNLDGWENTTSTPCATAALCVASTGTCTTPACGAGQTRCQPPDRLQPQRCNVDRTAWENTTTSPCATAALCNATTATCTTPTCAVGQRSCIGAQPAVCNADRTAYVSDGSTQCANAVLCNTSNGTCITPTCQSGQRRCDPMRLYQPQTCNTNLNGWADVTPACANEVLCNAGVCTDPTCQPGQTQCQGNQPQTCNANQNGWNNANGGDPCGQGLCNPANATCFACLTGQRRCMGDQPQQCNAQRTGWTDAGGPCASLPLCNMATGMCIDPACMPNERRCTGNVLEKCKTDLTDFMTLGTCVNSTLCQQSVAAMADMCMGPACQSGDKRCDPSSPSHPQVCNANQTGWTDVTPVCVNEFLCNAGVCTDPACQPNQRRCSPTSPNQPQVCNANQTDFTDDGSPCDPQVCNAGACVDPPMP